MYLAKNIYMPIEMLCGCPIYSQNVQQYCSKAMQTRRLLCLSVVVWLQIMCERIATEATGVVYLNLNLVI